MIQAVYGSMSQVRGRVYRNDSVWEQQRGPLFILFGFKTHESAGTTSADEFLFSY
jgi:hypothetical protein